MIERFIRNNIKTLNHHLTMGFLESKNIFPTEDEAIIITNFIKENYSKIINNDMNIFLDLKGRVREDIFTNTINLLNNLKKDYL